jgi:fumarate hydratase subunit alpha
MAREIKADQITDSVKKLCIEANIYLEEPLKAAFHKFAGLEESGAGREVFHILEENAAIAEREKMPVCQDTGITIVFVKIGQDAHVIGGGIEDAINEGVRQGYKEGYLRKSVLSDPIERKNTNDNTPAVIYYEIVPGDALLIEVAPKGGGSENMSAIKMLKPSQGIEGVKEFVVDTVLKAGPNPCPPIIVGVGIGGTFEKAALLSKKAVLRPFGKSNPDEKKAALENELLVLINKTGIGPAGFGGRITAMQVNVETYPCHIASLPVAVNIQCHASRHKSVML